MIAVNKSLLWGLLLCTQNFAIGQAVSKPLLIQSILTDFSGVFNNHPNRIRTLVTSVNKAEDQLMDYHYRAILVDTTTIYERTIRQLKQLIVQKKINGTTTTIDSLIEYKTLLSSSFKPMRSDSLFYRLLSGYMNTSIRCIPNRHPTTLFYFKVWLYELKHTGHKDETEGFGRRIVSLYDSRISKIRGDKTKRFNYRTVEATEQLYLEALSILPDNIELTKDFGVFYYQTGTDLLNSIHNKMSIKEVKTLENQATEYFSLSKRYIKMAEKLIKKAKKQIE